MAVFTGCRVLSLGIRRLSQRDQVSIQTLCYVLAYFSLWQLYAEIKTSINLCTHGHEKESHEFSYIDSNNQTQQVHDYVADFCHDVRGDEVVVAISLVSWIAMSILIGKLPDVSSFEGGAVSGTELMDYYKNGFAYDAIQIGN